MIQSRVSASLTLALLERVRQLRAAGEDLASFAAGEPDFPTPDVVVEAATKAMKAGNTKYVSTEGIPAFRSAIAKDYRDRLEVPWVDSANVLATAGAKQGLYLVLAALLSKNDEVLIPKPYWVSYPSLVKAAGGEGVYLETAEDERFFPTPAQLDKLANRKTKALIFSSPCNPTGLMIEPEKLRRLVEWCTHRKIVLVYDELYERLVLDGSPHVSALKFADEISSDYVVSINAFSKTMAMTGWRLGYAVSSKKNISALAPLQGQMMTCLPGFVQEAGVAGLVHVNEYLPGYVKLFQERLTLSMKLLKEIPDLYMVQPQGAFYIFVNIEKPMRRKGLGSDREFCEVLLNDKKVVVIPGSSMGMPGWIRLSFATSNEEITKGMKRLKEFCS